MTFGVLGVKGFGLINIIKLIGSAFLWLGNALLMVGRFMLANPLILAITLLWLLTLIYRNWGSIGPFFQNLWNSIGSGASQLWQRLVGFLTVEY
jgi:hypothetical protein